jgi:hypothetical protein
VANDPPRLCSAERRSQIRRVSDVKSFVRNQLKDINVKHISFITFSNRVTRSVLRGYLLGSGLGSGNANVAEADAAGEADPAGDSDDVDVADGTDDGVGVGVGGGGIIFSQ